VCSSHSPKVHPFQTNGFQLRPDVPFQHIVGVKRRGQFLRRKEPAIRPGIGRSRQPRVPFDLAVGHRGGNCSNPGKHRRDHGSDHRDRLNPSHIRYSAQRDLTLTNLELVGVKTTRIP